jgi:hypothetical protein
LIVGCSEIANPGCVRPRSRSTDQRRNFVDIVDGVEVSTFTPFFVEATGTHPTPDTTRFIPRRTRRVPPRPGGQLPGDAGEAPPRKIARAGVNLDLVYVATQNRVVFGAPDPAAVRAALDGAS